MFSKSQVEAMVSLCLASILTLALPTTQAKYASLQTAKSASNVAHKHERGVIASKSELSQVIKEERLSNIKAPS